jgi:hypothetical protein
MGVAWPTPEYNLPRGTSGLPVVTRPPPPPYPLRGRRIRPALPLGPARSGRAPSRCPAWPDPYLSRSGLPPEASRLPSGYSISRAVALASVDNSIPPDLLPRLRTVLAETRVCDGLYIRDLANIALDERAGSRPTPCPAGPSGDPPGPRAPCSRRPPGPGPAPTLPGPALPAAAPRGNVSPPAAAVSPVTGPSGRPSPLSSIGDFSVDLDNSGSDSDATSLAASDGPPPTPPGATPYSSPSPIPARRPPRSSPSPARRPAARATLHWPPRSRRPGPPTPADEDPALPSSEPELEQ